MTKWRINTNKEMKSRINALMLAYYAKTYASFGGGMQSAFERNTRQCHRSIGRIFPFCFLFI